MQFIHPFPARMAPDIALRIFDGRDQRMKVLDPMMGSGTTLVSARMRGHEAVGLDTDPLAVLVASAAIKNLDTRACLREGRALLDSARELSKSIALADAYPEGADEETCAFIRFWFDPSVRRQLTALTTELRHGSFRNRKLLQVAISRMIITKQGGVSKAIDVSHSRPHRRTEGHARRPFDIFEQSLNAVLRGAHFNAKTNLPKAVAKRGDCRRLPFQDGEFDCILTSPPYLNAIDYLRGHKLSLVWFNHSIDDLRTIRSNNVGSERGIDDSSLDSIVEAMVADVDQLSPKLLNTLRLYVADLKSALSEMRRVVRSGGELTFVVGDCTIKGTEVRNSLAVESIAGQLGLDKMGKRQRRRLPPNRRYLPPPSKSSARRQLQKRMRDEIIVRFRA